jgi:hypothetical protein
MPGADTLLPQMKADSPNKVRMAEQAPLFKADSATLY